MSQHRRYASRLRQARIRRFTLIGLCAALALVLLIFALRAIPSRAPATDAQATAEPTLAVTKSAPPLSDAASDPVEDESTLDGEGMEGEDQGIDQAGQYDDVKLLPVIYRKADMKKKRVAITIDDCFSADILKSIITLARKYDADLTFFPKGKNIEKNAALWKRIYEDGYEIENHSFPHSNVTKLSDDELRAAIVDSEKALNAALGVNYHMRLFRCPTGAGMKDPRLHQLLRELGYEAVASWGLSGARKAAETLARVQSGQILLFHATQADYARLKTIIPALSNRGYKMVSVNALYGKGKNEVTALETYDH